MIDCMLNDKTLDYNIDKNNNKLVFIKTLSEKEIKNADNNPINLSENTAYALKKGVYNWDNFTYIPTTVLHDFFGKTNIENDDNINIIFGIYIDLIKSKGISVNLLNKCFLSNRLDELIHKKFTYHTSGYYDLFKKNNLVIGKTFYGISNYDYFEINNDDYCSFCQIKGQYTKEYYFGTGCGTDCFYCYNKVCKKCAYFDEDILSCIHFNCFSNTESDINTINSNNNLIKNINSKISNCISYDNKRFKIKGNVKSTDIIELLKIQNTKCYICNEYVLLTGYQPHCSYQFSIDRIDNSLPHNRENILISCYYCNCRNHPSYLDNHKICQNRCHTIPKYNIINRNKVNVEIINNLRLK